MSDVAIAHDRFVTLGGAERVALEHARNFDAPIYAGQVNQSIVPDDIDVHEVFDTKVGTVAFMDRMPPLLTDAYQMYAWQHVPKLYEHETIIVNKTNPGWFVPKDTQTTVWYLHSTPRGMYDQFYRHGGSVITNYRKSIMRALYLPNTRYADAWACNSELVARRLDRYWDINTDRIIYPPVTTAAFSPDDAPTSDYYFTLGRLRRHKRNTEIVAAANNLNVPLVVAGDGPMRETLEDKAGPTVTIAGYVSESRKKDLLSGAKAFIINAENEDFGMTPIEAMAAGTPVLGVRDGFTEYQIHEPDTGVLYHRGELADAIRKFEETGVKWSANQIATWATQQFGREQFHTEMRELVADAEEKSQIKPQYETPTELVADGGD